ncbi:hypothetical protein CC86DRAFT_379307 [Ophiobolus disseminans]|uniref:Protein prenylyltransferase n=1 Tax=Ophiobolus disseminans TaxID=1469910 RepID=A0A6A7AAC2_9PLEO|nr:hypothetical protein CC86DRAFT_379307 [Ophiobolus disseminans]
MASHGISRGSGPVVRSEEARQKELQQINQYKDFVDLVNTKITEKQYTIEVLGHVTKLLNENPEYYTIWNHRRQTLNSLLSGASPAQSPDDLMQGDLQLTFALLRKYPKCYWIWNHRDWLLHRAEAVLGVEAARKLWTGELHLVNKMLHADSRNFHAWSYRRVVVSQIERLAIATADGQVESLAESEFEYTTKMIKINLSNFSAWHNRSQLIPQILAERNADSKARRAFFGAELSLICEAINTDPFDQSIWFYHQYLLSTISPSCPPHRLVVLDLTNGERQRYYEHETEYIKEILEDEADCKWIYEGLLGLAEAYLEVDAGFAVFGAVSFSAFLFQAQNPSIDDQEDVDAEEEEEEAVPPTFFSSSGAEAGWGDRGARLIQMHDETELSEKLSHVAAHSRPNALVACDAPAQQMHSTSSLTPPSLQPTPTCRRGPMSKWRQKGFVQDSDEDEEESQLESQASRKNGSVQGRVERVVDIEKSGEEPESGELGVLRTIEDGGAIREGGPKSHQPAREEEPPSPAPKRISPRRPTTSPLTPAATYHPIRKPTESPDPLQDSSLPRSHLNKRNISSQILGSPHLGIKSAPAPRQHSNDAVPSQAPSSLSPQLRLPRPRNADKTDVAPNVLGAFGIDPLSDASEDEALSDPPTDLESPETRYITPMPHRRTAVQVVIPSSAALQRQTLDQDPRREFRQRKPIQMHPYALEGERYRREVQSRGLKPVPRPRSPERRAGHDAETQEKEFDPNATPLSSPPEFEIPVSTPVIHRQRKERAPQESSTGRHAPDPIRHRLPATQLHLPHAAKRRKLNLSSTQATPVPRSIFDNDGSHIWSIPSNSPPHSSSPLVTGHQSTHRFERIPTATPAPNLPTPSTSSVFQDDPQPLLDSDSDPVPRSARRSSSGLRKPPGIILSDDSSSDSDSSSEAAQSDNEVKKVGKKIKGVLPASWLRFDRQAQERRKARARELDRARLMATQFSEPPEPQRGVAQRVLKRAVGVGRSSSSTTPAKDVVVISDASEDEGNLLYNDAGRLQESVETAAALAAALDSRYANDDLDSMENDRLHLFTLGGTGAKRKKQTKVTDAFGKAKRLKTSDGTARKQQAGASGRKQASSRRVRRTPPPAMSVVDVDLSPSKHGKSIPQFLRLARRQALQRPDLAREGPQSKQIRLHNARDTEDANATLEQWRRGSLNPKGNVPLRRKSGRSPLSGKVDNQQNVQPLSQGGRDLGKGLNTSSEAKSYVSQDPRRTSRHSGLEMFLRTPTQKTTPSKRTKQTRKSHQLIERSIRRGPLPLRAGQLEGDETVFGHGHRKIAFETGLRYADRQALAVSMNDHSFMNPQLARFLADEDAVLPPLPSAKDIGELPVEVQQPAPPRRRLVRKKIQAQRVDVDAREYRQPSEPAVQEVLNISKATPYKDITTEDQTVLQGLGPYGTRYPTTFDVITLRSETYFHSSTLIGSEDLKRALSVGKVGTRDLDELAGYCTITCDAATTRCGPWNDEISSALHDMARVATSPLELETTPSDGDAQTVKQKALTKIIQFIRSFINYVSVHLSFSDPVDRKSFVTKTHQLMFSLFDQISVVHATNDEEGPGKALGLSCFQAMVYLLASIAQIRLIAQHPVVDGNVQSELQRLSHSISRVVITCIVQKGILELDNFLQQNKRHAARQNGIQQDEVLVEGVVVCMHALDRTMLPGLSFWDFVNQELCSVVADATHLHLYESTWATLFTLVPFVEFDLSGIPSRDKRESFSDDNWSCISVMLKRVFELYPSTYKQCGSSLNDYVRANLVRCHRLIKYWHWQRPELMLHAVFDFFGKNGLKQLRRESTSGSASFLDGATAAQASTLEPNESSFHVALKCLVLGLRGMCGAYTEKKLRSFVFRCIPNHGRSYPKDQPLDEESFSALRNHHDLLCTLYWAAPPQCRPKLDHIRSLVSHENSHREACRVNVRAWANLMTFQLSTDEPYASAKLFALWHKDIMHLTLKQYRLAKTEADDYLKSGVLDGTTDVSAVMVRNTMERNQEQVIATLLDCIAGMRKAMQSASAHTPLDRFLVDSDIVHLLELPHLEDRRLVNVIRDTLAMLQEYAKLHKAARRRKESQPTSEESQDYGDFPDLDDLDGIDPQPTAVTQQNVSLGFIQIPLWHLLSNAFGAETSPDDNLLMDCVDTWVRVADSQVTSGVRSWSYYIESFSQVSWQQLRDTEQTRKFGSYFLSAIVECDHIAYEEHRQEFLTALLLSLVDRESMLRFQHRLLHAIAGVDNAHPLLKNLPFFRSQDNGEWDIAADTVRSRRLALISSMLSNMRDDLRGTARTTEAKRTYATMVKDFMTRMKSNYQQLRQGSAVTGAYVEFVQKIVQFLKQYTGDFCHVLPFFTDSVAFPLPAADPKYVVGRLCGYAPKAMDLGTAKELSVYIGTTAQQAAAENQQIYLVGQLTTAVCSGEVPAPDRAALRSALLQGIFPTYLEQVFSSSMVFLIGRPILETLRPILETMIFDLRITQPDSLSVAVGCIVAVSHAFIRGTEQLKIHPTLLEQTYVLSASAYMFEAMASLVPILDYICSRTSTHAHSSKPPIVTYMTDLSVYITETLHGMMPHTRPRYRGDAHATSSDKQHAVISSFCKRGLEDIMKANWSESGGAIWFGQHHAKKEAVFDIGSLEEEKVRLIGAIGSFEDVLQNVYGEEQHVEEREDVGGDVFV